MGRFKKWEKKMTTEGNFLENKIISVNFKILASI
jgi:hypothetical protein